MGSPRCTGRTTENQVSPLDKGLKIHTITPVLPPRGMSIEYGQMDRDDADLVFGGLFDTHYKVGAQIDDLPYGSPASNIRHMGKLVQFAPTAMQYFEVMARHLNFDFAINFGDTIEDTGNLRLDYRAFVEIIQGFRRMGIDILHLIGNHERQSIPDGLLKPQVGVAEDDPFYFSRDFCDGDYRIIAMETPIHLQHEQRTYKGAPCEISDEQLHWLDQEIRTASGEVIVISHHPFANNDLTNCAWFAKKPHRGLVPNRAAVRNVLEAHADQVMGCINGHLHIHQLVSHNGIDYLTVDSATEDIGATVWGKPRAQLEAGDHVPGLTFAAFYVKDGRIIADMHGFSQPNMDDVADTIPFPTMSENKRAA